MRKQQSTIKIFIKTQNDELINNNCAINNIIPGATIPIYYYSVMCKTSLFYEL